MQLKINYHNCDRSLGLESRIQDLHCSKVLTHPLISHITCWVTKEIHHEKKWYGVKLVIHTKHHEDFACRGEDSDPYKAFSKAYQKAKHHFQKQEGKLAS